VPTDSYMGLPIYENVLKHPWPDHPEYEFKDDSYSARGVAVYHGWLPLYSVAAAFNLAGIQPDPPGNTHVIHSQEEMDYRTAIARVPAVVYSVFFMVFLYLAGRAMYGEDAGWAALVVGAFSASCVQFGRQARYYSATVALGAGCCLCVWQMHKRGRWMDYIFGGCLFSLLFHTHLLTFFILGGVCLLVLPGILRQPKAILKLIVFGGIQMLAILPWFIYTGFLSHASDIPKAWKTMIFPNDLLTYPMEQLPFAMAAIIGMIGLILAIVLRNRLPERFTQPFFEYRTAWCFLATAAIIGYLAFWFLIPAASFFSSRITLALVWSGVLFGAILFATIARLVLPKYSVVLAPALYLGFVWFCGSVVNPFTPAGKVTNFSYLMDWMRWQDFKPGTRFYATPNEHLPLTFYTGIGVQSVAPVRKAFLDTYPGDVVVVEMSGWYYPMTPDRVEKWAQRSRVEMSRQEAVKWSSALSTQLIREDLEARGIEVFPPMDSPIPPFARRALKDQRLKTKQFWKVDYDAARENPAIFRGYELRDFTDWWPIFFYRFVHPEERMREKLNYHDRVNRGRARVFSSGWVVYISPGSSEPADRGVAPVVKSYANSNSDSGK